jgi:hypothetical protein
MTDGTRMVAVAASAASPAASPSNMERLQLELSFTKKIRPEPAIR